jgi:hypothetical protein
MIVQSRAFSGFARLPSSVVLVRSLAVLLVLVLGVAAMGCGDSADDRASRGSVSDEADVPADDEIEVPDVSGQDGSAAQSDVEAAGLSATFADANDEPGFDTTRDGSGCEVTDQSPVAGEMVADGDEVEVTIDCSQVDWEKQEGPGWEAFSDAYSSAFDDGCQALFDESPDGALYEDDEQYTVTDCQNLKPGDGSEASDIPSDAPDDPEAVGTALGELDGCHALFDDQGVISLNWGEDSITSADCPIAGGVTAPAPRKKSKTSSTGGKGAGQGCSATEADGAPIRVKIDKGKVNCSGAQALWREFRRRSPTDGAGSSGAMTLDGWQCAAATVTEAPRLGGCNRVDNSAGFAVYAGE